MPVQINEMVIRANIREPAVQPPTAPASAGSTDVNREELVRECAALVMEMLQIKTER